MKSLQTVLLVNAVSSGATGLLLITLTRTIAPLFGAVAPGIFVEAGLFLLGFAGYVGYVAYRSPTSLNRVQVIIWLDRLWVIASLVVLALPGLGLTLLGKAIIGAVAAWVALMAYLQAANARKITA